MNDNRNVIIAIILCMAILFGWSIFIEQPRLEAEQQRQAEMEATQAMKDEGFDPDTPARLPDDMTPQHSGDAANPDLAPGGTDSAQLSRDKAISISPRIGIANNRLQGTISLKGARIDDLTLTDYKVTLEDDSPNVPLLSPTGSINPYLAEFGWSAQNAKALGLPDKNTLWTPVSTGPLSPDSPVTLRYQAPSGLVFERVIKVDHDYLFTVTDTVKNNGGTEQALFPFALVKRIGTPETSPSPVVQEGPFGVLDDDKSKHTLKEFSYSDLEEDKQVKFDTVGGWLGITGKYFMTAVIPDQDTPVTAEFRYGTSSANRPIYQTNYVEAQKTIAPGGSVSVTHRLFAGAKEVDLVDRYREEQGIARFDLAIDWGWFFFLTKPIFHVLHFLYLQVGNFGVAIILLTAMVKLLFFPLANKSYESMSRMKKVQPELMEIREKHKGDAQKQQQAMMELYKREKVNPLSGCLPMIVQIPVFFSLYKVLYVSIEMRHAPFFGWIQDLSEPDPLHVFTLFGLIPWDTPSFLSIGIWPLIMGLSMFAQQKLNPPPADPTQARIFMLMPIFFTFLLGSFASGLVIYWTANNLMSIAQQYTIMRRMGVPIGGGTDKDKAKDKDKSDDKAKKD